MHQRKRFAVHADGQHRVSSVTRQIDGEATGPAIDAPTEQLLGSLAHADEVEEIPQRDSLPGRVADVRPADLVRDATNGDRSFDLREGRDVVVGQFDLVVDHPADAQPPFTQFDRGERESGVDAVEVVVRRDVGRLTVVEPGESRVGRDGVGVRGIDVRQRRRTLLLDTAQSIRFAVPCHRTENDR